MIRLPLAVVALTFAVATAQSAQVTFYQLPSGAFPHDVAPAVLRVRCSTHVATRGESQAILVECQSGNAGDLSVYLDGSPGG